MSTVRSRRLTAAVMAALLIGGTIGCSSGSGSADASLPQYTPDAAQSASSSAEPTPDAQEGAGASGTPVAPEEVTPDALSDPEVGFVVTSVPEGMTPLQAEVVQDYAAYERFTWGIWRTPKGTGPGTEGIEEVSRPESIQRIQKTYDERRPGMYSTGTFRVAIQSVNINENTRPMVADIEVCVDLSEVLTYDETGREITSPDRSDSHQRVISMDNAEVSWKSLGETRVSTDECVV